MNQSSNSPFATLKISTACILLLAISACATPSKKPLRSDSLAKIERVNIHVQADLQGVGVQYKYLSFVGAGIPYGPTGVLIAGTIEELANAEGMAAAASSAEELVAGFDLGHVQDVIQAQLSARLVNHPLLKKAAVITAVDASQSLESTIPTRDHTLTVKFEYYIDPDLRTLVVVGTAYLYDALENRDAPPTPLSERKTVYRNRFEYHSNQLKPAPVKSKEEIAAFIKAIRAKYPRARSNDQQFLAQKEAMKEARRKPSLTENADYHVKQWLADDAARLRLELTNGIGGVLDLLASDLLDSRKANTSTNKPEKVAVDTKAARELVRFTSGPFAGALSSQPLGYVEPESTGVLYSEKLRKKNGQADKIQIHGPPHTR